MATQSLADKKAAFIERYMAAAAALLAARLALVGLKSEWDSNGYSAGIAQADIVKGSQLHLTPTILGNGMNEQVSLETFLAAAGRLTNWNALVSQ
jgi:hypothetical protein